MHLSSKIQIKVVKLLSALIEQYQKFASFLVHHFIPTITTSAISAARLNDLDTRSPAMYS